MTKTIRFSVQLREDFEGKAFGFTKYLREEAIAAGIPYDSKGFLENGYIEMIDNPQTQLLDITWRGEA